ncbi:hypothetical protein DRJ22_03145 [Candidatus Woesearchaeota archaeon]|nr:MAG: hypothetical protein B6U93_01155 [Candidatus Woesearchaeota archaeon ex4484_78]RLE45961.1 MAG: hypothetical protein DRJ22_03145 [Candidatus Woesearchaeota archaeon]
MKAAIISIGSVSSRMIEEELKKKFDYVDHLKISELEVGVGEKGEIFYKGEPFKEYDAVYCRGSYKYAGLLRSLTTLIYKKCYTPMQPGTFSIAHDKLLTHLKFQDNGIPQPKTFVATNAEAGKKILRRMTFPVIIKLLGGTHGRGVIIAESIENARSTIDVISLLKQPFLVQEYIATEGIDIRAVVIGEKVIAMKRKASREEGRANIHSGGTPEPVNLDAKTKKLALQAARVCGCDICAVDILPSSKGPLVLELNISPGLQGITKATKKNVAGMIADFIFKKAQSLKEVVKKEVMKEILPEQEVYSTLDFRGERILLPAVFTKFSQLTEDDEVSIIAKKGEIKIKKIGKIKK